jgi:hypothetical protein
MSEGKAEAAAEYKSKVITYKQKVQHHLQKAAENRQKAESLRKFDDKSYVMKALEDDDPSIQKLAVKRLIRDTDYPGLMKAVRSAYPDVSKMAKEALENNKGLFDAIKRDLLVLALDSSETYIRRIAIEELEALANTKLGYDPDSAESDRKAALARWQEWLAGKLRSGLSGVYYKGSNFDKEMLVRVDKEISFEWGKEPHEMLPKDKFSIRWIGKIKIPESGKYTLSVDVDDGAKVWIGKGADLEQIISVWSEYSYAANKEELHLEAGLYDIKIEYYENSKKARMKLFWDSEDDKKRIVPEENLFHLSYE